MTRLTPLAWALLGDIVLWGVIIAAARVAWGWF
jgi:hypothetical protein